MTARYLSYTFFDSDGFLLCPTYLQSPVDCGRVYVETFAPLTNCKSLAIRCYVAITSAVQTILFYANPSTIIGRIPFVIVDAVKFVFRVWSGPHIMYKVFERIKPPITNCYTSSAISKIGLIVRVMASTFHITPSVIFRSMRKAVSRVSYFIHRKLDTLKIINFKHTLKTLQG